MPQSVVLIIAPDTPLRETLADDLRHAGCEVQTAANGSSGLEKVRAFQPDVVFLPQQLPEEDSLDICRRIQRGCGQGPRPVFLLAPDSRQAGEVSDNSDVQLLDMDRLAAGLGTLASWRRLIHDTESIRHNGLLIDYAGHRVILGDSTIGLTPTEFRLLWTLARRPGRVFSRQELSGACRGENARLQARTIDVHVKSIRQKLGDHAYVVETVHGVGYRFHESDVPAPARTRRRTENEGH